MRTAAFAALILSFAIPAHIVNAADNEDSPYYVPPAGSKLTVNRALTVPAGQASIFIQDGRVMSFSEVRQYEPHCKLQMQHIDNNPQTVQPGEFVVNKAKRERTQHSRAPSVAPGFVYVMESHDRSYELYATHLLLNSGQQPQVYGLTCQQWQDPIWPNHVTLRQIQKTLGDLLSLRVNP